MDEVQRHNLFLLTIGAHDVQGIDAFQVMGCKAGLESLGINVEVERMQSQANSQNS